MTCPICKRPVAEPADLEADSFYPFCSERCKLVDLGNWASGEYVIPAPLKPEDEDTAAQKAASKEPGNPLRSDNGHAA